MSENTPLELEQVLAAAEVDPAVFALRPDYRAMLLAVDGLAPGSESGTAAEAREALLLAAEAAAAKELDQGGSTGVDQIPHVAAWREAYRGFGAKPAKTRNSLEALIRRAPAGLPRVNPLTDLYNAISVLHQIPLGGEDLARYTGAPRLIRATGNESFDTVADGEPVIEHPEPGEVVWSDGAGVTCRRWNWRQGRRTALTGTTTSALFILDALGPITDEALTAATDDLLARLGGLARPGAEVRSARRMIAR